MKKLARLVLFFSLCFAVLFLVSTGLRFLAIRVGWVRALPQQPETVLAELILAVRWALSLGLYGSILLGLSYTARERIFAPAAALCLVVLSLGFSFGVSLGMERLGNVPPARNTVRPLGERGLILTHALRPGDTAIVLLQGPAEPGGARVVAIPGRPLLYQEGSFPGGNDAAPGLPPVPFRDDSPWFLKSMAIDIKLNAGQLEQHFKEGLLPFLTYAGALIFFLVSLGFILKFSAWPLANLFLGCLAFRGVLALETFFNSPDMQDVFESFLGKRLPVSLTVPLIFCGFGLLVYLYSFFVYLAKRRDSDDY